MTDKRPLRLPSAKLVLIAAIAGIGAGIGAVVIRDIQSEPQVQVAEVQDAALCAASQELINAIRPFSKGEVAAMVPADESRYLDLSFNNAKDEKLTTASFAGKTVLLNLWATWCVPCREEMPALNNLQAKEGGDNFEVVAVNIDTSTAEKPMAFMEEYKIDALSLYLDNTMDVFNDLKKKGLAFGLPATILLDDNGCVLAAMNGPAAWDSEDAIALIQAAKK